MSEQCGNYEDMLYFERRLTEIVANMEPKAQRWRIAFVATFVLTAYGAYFWIVDPSIRSVTLLESLINHPLFTISLLVLLTLIFVFGIHKKVVSPRITVQRMRVALADFSLSCDDKGKLIMMPPLGAPASKPSYLFDSSSFARRPIPKPSPNIRRSRDSSPQNESPISQMTPEEDEFIRQQFASALDRSSSSSTVGRKRDDSSSSDRGKNDADEFDSIFLYDNSYGEDTTKLLV